ncbi:putative ribonuclease H-like domain-containing protein [Tanacetum coccineum]
MLADSKLPTMFWTEAVRTACYVLNRVLVTSPHNKTPYALLTGNIPSVSHFKPFGCHVTILNTSDHLGKFDGKADEGYIVGYSASNRAYRVYNVHNKRVEETMNLRYLEEKPNVQGLGHEWYFDLDYLTDTLGYKRVQANQSAGTQEASTNPADEKPKDTSSDEGDDSPHDFAEEIFQQELARLKGQVKRATSDVKDAEELQQKARTKIVPPGSIPVPTGSIKIPSGGTTISPSNVSVPTGSLTNSFFDDEPTTRFPSPSDLGNNEPSLGIFSSSSYDDEFGADLNNLASTVEVSPVATKRINTIHPQSLIIRDHTSAVQTRSKVNKTPTGESAFISYIHDQQRNNHTDLSVNICLFACFFQVEQRTGLTLTLKIQAGLMLYTGRDANSSCFKMFGLCLMTLSLVITVTSLQRSTQMTLPPVILVSNLQSPSQMILPLVHQLPVYPHLRVKLRLSKVNIPPTRPQPVPTGKPKVPALVPTGRQHRPFPVPTDRGYSPSVTFGWWKSTARPMPHLNRPTSSYFQTYTPYVPQIQDKYVQEILKKFDLECVRTATTPYEAPRPKSKNEPDSPVNVHLYRSMIDSLMYLTASRPYIMFTVSACSSNQVTPTTSNLEAVKKIFKYLKGQPRLGLWYPRESPFVLEAYSDSDYVGANKDRKSTTGGCQFLGRRLISWQCKKQTIVATSSTEAEYVAAANCCGQDVHTGSSSVPSGVTRVPTGSFHFSYCINSHCDPQPAQNLNPILKSSMAALRYRDEHNKVGYLQKPKGNDDYHQILNFLGASHIRSPELGPSAILATIDATPYTITEESVIRGYNIY